MWQVSRQEWMVGTSLTLKEHQGLHWPHFTSLPPITVSVIHNVWSSSPASPPIMVTDQFKESITSGNALCFDRLTITCQHMLVLHLFCRSGETMFWGELHTDNISALKTRNGPWQGKTAVDILMEPHWNLAGTCNITDRRLVYEPASFDGYWPGNYMYFGNCMKVMWIDNENHRVPDTKTLNIVKVMHTY